MNKRKERKREREGEERDRESKDLFSLLSTESGTLFTFDVSYVQHKGFFFGGGDSFVRGSRARVWVLLDLSSTSTSEDKPYMKNHQLLKP